MVSIASTICLLVGFGTGLWLSKHMLTFLNALKIKKALKNIDLEELRTQLSSYKVKEMVV